MSEASLWDYLKTVLPAKGHYSRIESETAQGFPDIHYTLDGFSGTIELKFAHNPNSLRPFSVRGLRKSQMDWAFDEDQAGGRVWICSQVGETIYLVNGNIYWDDFNGFTLPELTRVAHLIWRRGIDYPTKELAAALLHPL